MLLPLALSAALLFPSTAAAETILITSGFLEMGSGNSPFELVGDRRGFRLFGVGYLGGFSPNAFVFCGGGNDCGPGDVARFEHASGGLDLPASATLDGIFYEEVNSLSGPAFAGIGFSSRFLLPPFNSTDTAIVRAPFTMEGSFSVHDQAGVRLDMLAGSGMATSTWHTFGSDVWNLSFVRYDFSPAPIPEPGTLLLVGAAGAAAAAGRRKRRTR